MSPLVEQEVYRLLGSEGFARLSAAFYRQIPDDDILGPMYPPDDLPAAEGRLRDFLIYRFGGPQDYIEQRGHPRLRMRHAPFAIDSQARERWMELMRRALEEAETPGPAAQFLTQFFEHMSSFLINRSSD